MFSFILFLDEIMFCLLVYDDSFERCIRPTLLSYRAYCLILSNYVTTASLKAFIYRISHFAFCSPGERSGELQIVLITRPLCLAAFTSSLSLASLT